MTSSSEHPKPGLHDSEERPPRASDIRKKVTYDIDPLEEYLQSSPPPFSKSSSAPPPPPKQKEPFKPPPPPPPPVIDQEDFDDTGQAEEEKRERQRESRPPEKKSGVYQLRDPLATPPEGITPPKPRPSQEAEKPEEKESLKEKKKEGEEDDDQIHEIGVENLGRTRVYKVVRSYRSSTAIEQPCPVCGALVPADARQCPGCGHLM